MGTFSARSAAGHFGGKLKFVVRDCKNSLGDVDHRMGWETMVLPSHAHRENPMMVDQVEESMHVLFSRKSLAGKINLLSQFSTQLHSHFRSIRFSELFFLFHVLAAGNIE